MIFNKNSESTDKLIEIAENICDFKKFNQLVDQFQNDHIQICMDLGINNFSKIDFESSNKDTS